MSITVLPEEALALTAYCSQEKRFRKAPSLSNGRPNILEVQLRMIL
jgi:hypothetical protein